MSDYEVGRLYKATVGAPYRPPRCLVVYVGDVGGSPARPWYHITSRHRLRHDELADIHPVVVLDLTDVDGTQFDPARLAGLLTAAQSAAQTAKEARMVRSLRDQIIEQTKPPKPPEPKGLGAVVMDRASRCWVRADSSDAAWCSSGAVWRSYADIDVPGTGHILSDGVSESVPPW